MNRTMMICMGLVLSFATISAGDDVQKEFEQAIEICQKLGGEYLKKNRPNNVEPKLIETKSVKQKSLNQQFTAHAEEAVQKAEILQQIADGFMAFYRERKAQDPSLPDELLVQLIVSLLHQDQLKIVDQDMRNKMFRDFGKVIGKEREERDCAVQ